MKSRSTSNEVNANVCLGLSSLGFTFDSKLKFINGKDKLAGGKSARDEFGKFCFSLSTSRLTAGCSFLELVGKQKQNGIVFIDSFEGLTGIILEDFYKLRMKFVVK